MASFLPPIPNGKDIHRRGAPNLRYGNFEPLPTLQSGLPADEKLTTIFGTKQVTKTVCDWYEMWRPWQQKMMLAGMTDRISTAHLESLATTLEPVFHRDFVASLKKRYPSAPFRRQVKITRLTDSVKNKVHNEIKRGLSAVNKSTSKEAQDIEPELLCDNTLDTKLKSDTDKQGDVMLELSLPEQELIVIPKISEADNALLDTLLNLPKDEPGDSEYGSDFEGPQGNHSDCEGELKPNDSVLNLASNIAKDIITIAIGIATVDSAAFAATDVIGAVCAATDVIGAVCATNDVNELKNSDIFETSNSQTKPESIVAEIEDTDQPVMTQPPTAGIRDPTNGHDDGTLNSPRQKSAQSATSVQDFKSVLSSKALSAVDFFNKNNLSKLGRPQYQIQQAADCTDRDLTMQRASKNAKWWTDTDGRVMVKARKSKLNNQYKGQLGRIWEWLYYWEEHDKLTMLVEVIKLSAPDVINYLAQCLVHRLQDRTDINRLPDRLLLYIFSQLSVKEIYASSQVCRRWRYLCATDELWIVKCHEMGLQNNVLNITDIVLDANQDLRIDWKLAYNQLRDIVTETKETWQQKRDMNEAHEVSALYPEPCSTVAHSRDSRIRRSRNESKQQVSRKSSGGEDSDESENSDSEDLNVYISMNYDVVSTIAKSTKSKRSRSGATIKSTVSRRSLLKKSSKATLKSVSQDKQEVGPKEDELQNTEEREERLRQRKKRINEEEEFALDVRPAYRQAENVVGHAGLKPMPIKNIGQMVGKVNAVKRVRRLQGHMNGVLCVDYDDRRLMSGSLDRTIRIWDIRSGRGIHKLHGHKGGVRCLQFSNERLYSGSWDRTIMVWDIVHFQRIDIWRGHTDVISCLNLGKNLLASGSHDTTVRVWSLVGPFSSKVIKGHSAPVTSVQLCGGYKQVLSGSTDMTLRLSDIKTGTCIHVYKGASSPISAVLVRGNLIVAGTSRGHLYFWSKSNIRSEAGVKVHDEAVTALDFFKGRILTASEDTTVKEWDLNTLTCVRVLQGHRGPVQDVKVSKEQIVTCSDDGSVRIWDLFTPLLVVGDKNHEDSIHTELIDQRT